MTLTRTCLTYGFPAGLIVLAAIWLGLALGAEAGAGAEFLGYAIMLVALSLIFVGVKHYRDQKLGGVIGLGQALAVGLGIALVATLVYVLGWELTLAATDYRFIDEYAASTIEAKRAAGASAAEIAALEAELAALKAQYANPVMRIGITFIEIFPVGLVVALVSAALLRNSRLFPARRRPSMAGGGERS